MTPTKKIISDDEISRIEFSKLLDLPEIIIDIRRVADEEELLNIKSILTSNPGSTNLKVIYGALDEPRQIVAQVESNGEFLAQIRKYIVL